jgi:hypothetical protein
MSRATAPGPDAVGEDRAAGGAPHVTSAVTCPPPLVPCSPETYSSQTPDAPEVQIFRRLVRSKRGPWESGTGRSTADPTTSAGK